jgi:hypothetical protein
MGQFGRDPPAFLPHAMFYRSQQTALVALLYDAAIALSGELS